MDNTRIIISTDTFGKLIKEKRRSLGLSAEKLAELCDRSDKAIRNIESGKSSPSLNTVVNISYALKLNLGDLNFLLKDPYSEDNE